MSSKLWVLVAMGAAVLGGLTWWSRADLANADDATDPNDPLFATSGNDRRGYENAPSLAMGALVWELDPEVAFARSKQTGKPVLMLFTAEWCPPCRQLHDGPLEDTQVQQALSEKFIPLYMDVTEPSNQPANAVAQSYNVRSIPRFVVADEDRRQQVNTGASMGKYTLMGWIERQ